MTDQVNDATQEQNNDAQNNLASVPTVSYSGAVTRELKKGDLVRVAERYVAMTLSCSSVLFLTHPLQLTLFLL